MKYEHSLLDEVEYIKKRTQAVIDKKKRIDHYYSIEGKPQTEFTKDEKIYKGIKYSLHTIDKYFIIPLENTLLADLEIVNEEKIEELKKLKTNLKRLVKIRRHILQLADSYKYRSTLMAKRIRAKREPRENPDIERARSRAKDIWMEHSKTPLLDTAYKIKEELNIRKSVGTVQEWIRDLNPNAKKKKTSK